MATDLCFPIIKYSHATGVRSDNTVPWTHLQAQNLFAIIKGVDTHYPDGRLHPDGKLDMRIVQGTDVLETLNVARFVDAAIDARHGAERAGVTPQIEQLPIFGITKESLLALRYRLENGQARRLQLRMQNPSECRQIVSAFERRGMEFQEQRPRTARPGTGRPSTGNDRPLTAQSSSPYFEPNKAAARLGSFQPQALEAGSLSNRQPAMPEQSPTRHNEQHAPYSQDMAPPPFLRRDEVAAPREPAVNRPSTAQMYRSYTTPSEYSQHEAMEVSRRPSDPTGELPSSTSHVVTLESIREAAEESITPPHTAPYTSAPILQPPLSNHHWSSATAEPTPAGFSSDPAEPRPHTGRPSTAATTPIPETQEFDIPPRRELPFKRPDSRQSGSDRSGSRPGTAFALTMPPLPKLKPTGKGPNSDVRADSASPTKDTANSRPGTASPLKRTFNAFEEDAARLQTSADPSVDARLPASKEQSPTRATSSTHRSNAPEITAPQTSRMDELLYSRKPLSERSTNSKIARIDSLADAPHEIVSPPTSPAKATASGARDPTINAYAAIRTPMHDPREVSLEEYATQSLQDRQAALDEFMVENLENPAFTKLCEDVENCWRRMALGL